jgi:SAM-dependent methyltransferase
MMGITTYIPWWGKIATKIVLSRLPIQYEFWRKIGLFRHGEMAQPDYAYAVFKQHFDRAKLEKGFVSLELGPGDSLFSAMIAWSLGASASYLVDSGEFARKDIQPYRDMADFLTHKGLPTPNIGNCQSLEEVLASCCTRYLTSGLSSLHTLPAQSVDFIWSHAVLEHIRRVEFLDTMKELRRIIRDRGICSHQVDLRDHLSYALNNLRFPEKIWENDFMAQSGFYTNRIQYPQMLELFQQAGFAVEVVNVNRWDRLPTPRSKLSKEFMHLSDEDLCVSGFCVLLKAI